MLFLLEGQVAPTLELLFPVDDDLSAEALDSVVEVLAGEDYARARRQSLHLRASIAQLGQELLHKAELDHHVKVALDIDPVEESCRKLLEWVDSELEFGLREREAAGEGRVLGVERLDRGARQ